MRDALLALAAALLLPALPAAAQTGAVTGRVSLGIEGLRLADMGPVVVFLDAVEGRLSYATPRAVPAIHQHNARFSPTFLVIAAGQRVDMPNDDAIFHNVFSYSRPNDFDLGLYPAGESRSVTFEHAGLVRVYCSIHESMSASIFVAPSPWFAVAAAGGDYRIPDVPAGRYRLRTWNEKLPEAARALTVRAGRSARADFALGAPAD